MLRQARNKRYAERKREDAPTTPVIEPQELKLYRAMDELPRAYSNGYVVLRGLLDWTGRCRAMSVQAKVSKIRHFFQIWRQNSCEPIAPDSRKPLSSMMIYSVVFNTC